MRGKLISCLQVSAVYITLYAVSHASRSRTPLPQFLPSPLDALNQLAAAAEDHLYRNRSPSGSPTRPSTPTEETRGRKDSRTSAKSSASELGTLYAFAEMDALRQLCHTVEDVRILPVQTGIPRIADESCCIDVDDSTLSLWNSIIPLIPTTTHLRRRRNHIPLDRFPNHALTDWGPQFTTYPSFVRY